MRDIISQVSAQVLLSLTKGVASFHWNSVTANFVQYMYMSILIKCSTVAIARVEGVAIVNLGNIIQMKHSYGKLKGEIQTEENSTINRQ